jgi:hypothetical protein
MTSCLEFAYNHLRFNHFGVARLIHKSPSSPLNGGAKLLTYHPNYDIIALDMVVVGYHAY